MKTIKYILLALFLGGGITSCDGLKREDYTQVYVDRFFKTEQDFKLAMTGLYGVFNCDYSGVYAPGNRGYQVFTEMTTDALWCTWSWEWDQMHFHQWTATSSAGMAAGPTEAYGRYNFMSKARSAIRSIEASEVKQEIKDRYVAEISGLRGWMALYLFDLFGTLPIASDEILDSPQEVVYLPRATQEEWDNMIEQDLRRAIAGLPELAPERGRLTKGAARMILLKYYMMRGKFVGAETLARELVAQEGSAYALLSVYKDIFTKENVGNKEIVLQIPTNNPDMPNLYLAHIIPDNMPWAPKSATWGAYVIPWDFYDTFESGDHRLENITTSYTNKNGVLEVRGKGKLLKGAVPTKYGVDPDFSGVNCAIDLVVYRFSDVLLTLAECIVRNGGVTGEATALVDRVRARVGLAGLPAAATASTETFLEALLLERGHEFFIEGLRRQDLIRFGKYVEYANNRIAKANNGTYAGLSQQSYDPAAAHHTLYWIPASYVKESKDKVVQNTGYVN